MLDVVFCNFGSEVASHSSIIEPYLLFDQPTQEGQ